MVVDLSQTGQAIQGNHMLMYIMCQCVEKDTSDWGCSLRRAKGKEFMSRK